MEFDDTGYAIVTKRAFHKPTREVHPLETVESVEMTLVPKPKSARSPLIITVTGDNWFDVQTFSNGQGPFARAELGNAQKFVASLRMAARLLRPLA